MPAWWAPGSASGEAAAQRVEAALPDPAGELGFGGQRLRGVVGARVDVQLRWYARLHEAHRERDVLVAEQVDGAHVDERRRQPGQVLAAGRAGVLVGLAAAEVPL